MSNKFDLKKRIRLSPKAREKAVADLNRERDRKRKEGRNETKAGSRTLRKMRKVLRGNRPVYDPLAHLEKGRL